MVSVDGSGVPFASMGYHVCRWIILRCNHESLSEWMRVIKLWYAKLGQNARKTEKIGFRR